MKNNARTVMIMVASGMLAVAGTGCTTGEPVAQRPSVTSSSAETPEPYVPPYTTTVEPADDTVAPGSVLDDSTKAKIMVKVLEPEGIFMSESFASDYAGITCQGLRDGQNPMTVARIAASEISRYDFMEHAMIVGAAVGSHCPELGYMIDELTSGS